MMEAMEEDRKVKAKEGVGDMEGEGVTMMEAMEEDRKVKST
jgi:hypothetical protein